MRLKLILLFAWLSGSVFGQNVNAYIRLGDAAFESGNYYGAAEVYKEALGIEPNAAKIVYKCAEAYRMCSNFKEAEKMYKKVIAADRAHFPLAIFYLADILKSQGQYQKAQIVYRKYYEEHTGDNDYFSNKAKHEIISCEKALNLSFDIKGVEITSMEVNVNTVYSELGVFEIQDSILYFASYQPLHKYDTVNFQTRVLKAHKIGQFWSHADTVVFIKSDPSAVNNFCLCQDLKTMYFSNIPAGETNIKIFRSRQLNGEWQRPEVLADTINMPGTNSNHPSISKTAEGEILFFSSDRPGGYGRFDIWFCKFDTNGNLGELFNAGNKVNSIDDEITPFFNPDDSTLYFSSTWHDNLGNFDVFKAKGDPPYFRTLENLGYPINTSCNELYYTQNTSRTNAYFASNRRGSQSLTNENCCNDLYTYPLPKIKNDSVIAETKTQVIIKEMELLVPITLYFHNDEPNPKTTDTVTTVNYENSANGYLRMSEEYKKEFSVGLKSDDKTKAIEQVENFFSDYVEKGLNDLQTFAKRMEGLLESGENIVITLKGYTSPLNTAEYNKKLAKRRVMSLVNYFTEYKGGIFKPYIDGVAAKGNKITFELVAIGKELANPNVSDNLNDLRNSVYSPDAGMERRIQIIAVSLGKKM